MNYGYPYRGQPSVVYCTDFAIGGNTEQSYTSAEPDRQRGYLGLRGPDLRDAAHDGRDDQ